MYSKYFQPCIIEPTRIVERNKPSLIDNIFINVCTEKLQSGNLTNKIADHVQYFLVIQNLAKEQLINKTQIRDIKNLRFK